MKGIISHPSGFQCGQVEQASVVRASTQAKRLRYWQMKVGSGCMEMVRAKGHGWDTENIYKSKENNTFSIFSIESLQQ